MRKSEEQIKSFEIKRRKFLVFKERYEEEVNTVYQCSIPRATRMKFRAVYCVALHCLEFIFSCYMLFYFSPRETRNTGRN